MGVGAPNGDPAQLTRQISYEMYRQVNVYQTRKRKEEGRDVSWDVYNSPTLHYSGEPLIEITEIYEEQN